MTEGTIPAGLPHTQGPKPHKGDRKGPRAAYVLPIPAPPSKGVLQVDERMCGGCELCLYACSLHKEGVAAPSIARIRMRTPVSGYFDKVALPCLQCVDPQCLRYCPTGALHVDEKTGARVINEARCTGCQNCIQHCPFDPPRIAYDSVKEVAVKCDLCGGDPACVKACPFGALTYYTDPEGVRSGYGIAGV
ncbi:MAG: 4Fe-4S dicluster domain-containing protein [Chloroflexi bacterium]|nr:4Fe-4S dicluster domain-containing protein [Chloroflexota bacterium]